MYQIVFDDRSAPTTITETVFSQARQAYLALPADQEPAAGSQHVEPPPKVRNKAQSQRSNHDQQPAATAATGTTRSTSSIVC